MNNLLCGGKEALLVAVCLVLAGCKPPADSASLYDETSTTNATLTVALQQPVNPHKQTLFRAISEGRSLTLSQLDQGARAFNRSVSAAVSYTIPSRGSESRVRSRNRAKPNFNPDAYKDVYRGIQIGDRTFIFKLVRQPVFRKVDSWTVFTWFGATLLRDAVTGKYTATEDQVRHVLDTKIYEKRRIKQREKLVNAIDFAAHFIPGYNGAERLFYNGDTTGMRVLGAVELVGDLATLGLGSKIRVVQKTAAAVTITASTVRVSSAAYRASQGQANSVDGIDAFLATVEAGLAAVTLVKIKLTGVKGVVSNLDEAEVIGKQLGRSADDVMQNGLSKAELERLVGDHPSLRRLNQAEDLDDAVPGQKPRGSDGDVPTGVNPCKILSLLQDDLCELAALAPDVRKARRVEVAGGRDAAFQQAKRDAGGYFGQMEEITPRAGANANGNVARRELRGQTTDTGAPIYTREYWFRNPDGNIVVIQEHSLGHPGITGGEFAHFNVRHIPDTGDEGLILRALDRGAPPPDVPAMGHYDFATVN